jgi:hypothetical protein
VAVHEERSAFTKLGVLVRSQLHGADAVLRSALAEKVELVSLGIHPVKLGNAVVDSRTASRASRSRPRAIWKILPPIAEGHNVSLTASKII